MLDEFQDTSVFQYDNFKPLLDNALGYGYTNLVVGDIKQSIYRWRNSDWKLLAEKVDKDFQQFGNITKELEYNWRSNKNIVYYNNSVFSIAPSRMIDLKSNCLIKSSRSNLAFFLIKI